MTPHINLPLRTYRRCALLLLALCLLGLALPAAARQPPPPTEASRQTLPPAPSREPRLLRVETAAGGVRLARVELPAVADVYVASERPDQNFGANTLFLGYNLQNDSFGAQRVLLRFDLGSIPSGAVIDRARVLLRTLFISPADDAPMGTVLRRSASPWFEYAVTWDNEPTWGEIRASNEIGSALAWYDWDVTGLVADWLAGTYPNYGLEIIGDEQVQQRERGFYSRETTTEYYPRLIVDYTDVADDQPPIVSVGPLPAYVPSSFDVVWSGVDQGPAGIDYYDVQYRANGGDWIDWLLGVDGTSAEYNGQHGYFYEFRARGVDNAGNVEPWGGPEAGTTVDGLPPATQVAPLPAVTRSGSFAVSWSGSDDGSGVQYYDVQVRFDGGTWNLWLPQTLATGATFDAGEDGVYEFEARAVDGVGNREPFADRAEASTLVDVGAPFVQVRLRLPLVLWQSAGTSAY